MDQPDPRLYPSELADKERELIEARRTQAGANPREPCVGFALSGGGIRSATFCLGVFQSLARHGLLGRLDFLSTVSGGGYFGGFFGALFSPDRKSTREALRNELHLDPNAGDVATIEAALDAPRSNVVRWLRENGRYLSPVGAGDSLLAATVYLRNLVALHVVLGASALGVFLAGAALRPLFDLMGINGIAPPPLGGAAIWWSPWTWAVLAPLLAVAVPAGWAYWLTQRSVAGRDNPWALLMTIAVAVICLLPDLGLFADIDASLGWPSARPRRILSSLALLSVVFWLFCDLRARRKAEQEVEAKTLRAEGKLEFRLLLVRNRLSQWTKRGVMAATALLGFALVDSLGQSLYVAILAMGLGAFLSQVWTWPPIAAVLAVLGATKRLAAMIPARERLRVPVQLVAWVAALLVGVTALTVWAALADAFAWGGSWPYPDPLVWQRAAVGALAMGVLSFVIGQTMQFVNNSSHHAMYAARLTRAYLGASNQSRWTAQGSHMSDVLPGDAISMYTYRPYEHGGPLHVINVTLNETVGGRYQTEYRDRKGLGMAIGPAGVSIAASHHALWSWNKQKIEKDLGPALEVHPAPPGADGFHALFATDHQPHGVQNRQLGHWVAISGAAFTTGLGARTSLPLGVLLGLANVRLGYWWDSRVERPRGGSRGVLGLLLEKTFPVQSGLFDELLGRFWGPAKRYWYLSDGGHFENTACYELIRRRLPLIVCCDCGADPDYTWADLGNLVRKARIDFNAEIRFLEGSDLTKWVPADRSSQVCEASSIRKATFAAGADAPRGPVTCASAHAIVGHVYYLDSGQKRLDFDAGTAKPDSVLLVVKPSLTGDEPADVLEYARSHPSFPQEPTSDQYFDEAQWESYRKLGEHISAHLFGAGDPWCPGFPAREAGPTGEGRYE